MDRAVGLREEAVDHLAEVLVAEAATAKRDVWYVVVTMINPSRIQPGIRGHGTAIEQYASDPIDLTVINHEEYFLKLVTRSAPTSHVST